MPKEKNKSLPRYLSIVALLSLIIGIAMIFIVTNLAIWFFIATVVLWAVAKYFHKKNMVSEDKSGSKPDWD